MTFKELGLTARMDSWLDALGLSHRPPIQQQAIPHALRGRHSLQIAQTGLRTHFESEAVFLSEGGMRVKSAEWLWTGLGKTMIAATGIIAFLALPVLAQDGTGPMPDNAEARNYGGGWNCALGYRVDGGACVGIEIPENAYATGRSYGSGWACERGYEAAGGTSCNAIPVPENAFLRSSGYDWQCDRGYRQESETCVPIVLPDNAYLTDVPSGSGWTCARGFTASGEACVSISVPANGYLTNADYGDAWACERGFVKMSGRCDPIVLPMNAYLDPTRYGPGWRCERGFEPVANACVAINLPANAHLDRSGNAWRCDRSFRHADGECVLGR